MDDLITRAHNFARELREITSDEEWQRREPNVVRELAHLVADIDGATSGYLGLHELQEWKRRADELAATSRDAALRDQIRARAAGMVSNWKVT